MLGVWGLSRALRRWRLDTHRGYFEGKVVLITGGSRGIGRVLARAFAQRGASVALAARSVEQLEQVAAECEALNPCVETLIVPVDVTSEAELDYLVEETLARFGRIDVLVNNTGIRHGGAVAELDPDDIRRQIEVNLLAAISLTRRVLPAMLRRGRGCIVMMSSAAGRHTEPYFVPYGISKHGLTGFAEGLRRELAGSGVRVLTVSPGFTDTDMVTEIGPVYQRMGFPMIPPERVARRTLDGIVLGAVEVNLGTIETFGGYVSVLLPRLADLYWQVFAPRDFKDAARRQGAE